MSAARSAHPDTSRNADAARGSRAGKTAGLVGGVAAGTTLGLIVAAFLATQLFGFGVLAVQSASMEPAISSGDFAVSRPVKVDKVERGDVIVFRTSEDIAVAHRVVQVVRVVFNLEDSSTGEVTTESVEYRFTTRGDANPVNDSGFVTGESIVGEVWFSLPGFGLGDSAVSLQYLLLFVAAAFAGTWVVWEIRARRRGRETA